MEAKTNFICEHLNGISSVSTGMNDNMIITIIEYSHNLVKLLYFNSANILIRFYYVMIVLITIEDAFTPLPLRS